MSSISEVGHAKNLANLQKLIDLATQIGATYNPTNSQLTLANLTVLQTHCTTDYNSWLAKFTTYKSTTNNREIAFKPIGQLATQILDNVSALNIPQQTIDDVAFIVHKIHGYSKKIPVPSTDPLAQKQSPIPDPNPIPIPVVVDGVSTSQKSYDNLWANFDKLIQQLLSIASYNPNEANIKVPALQTLDANLKALNSAAVTAINAVGLARNTRNLTFYSNNTGMVDITKKVKKYIRQIEGSTSAIYHQATAIKFIKYVPRPKKKK